jgi:hypothetical protein
MSPPSSPEGGKRSSFRNLCFPVFRNPNEGKVKNPTSLHIRGVLLGINIIIFVVVTK